MSSPLFSHRWRPLPLLALNVFALVLLFSWLYPATRVFWDGFDDHLFSMLNKPLASSHSWALIWSIGSVRLTDIAVGLLMISFLVFANLVFPAKHLRHAFFGFFVLLIVQLIIREGFSELANAFEWQRASPSLVTPDAIRLTQMFPQWVVLGLKDAAGHSFPGDHAAVIFVWAFCLNFFVSGWKRALIWLLAIIFMMPRLVAGAHWGSDDFVGGLFISLLAVAWGCYTPLVAKSENWIVAKVSPMFDVLGRYIPFCWFAFFTTKPDDV